MKNVENKTILNDNNFTIKKYFDAYKVIEKEFGLNFNLQEYFLPIEFYDKDKITNSIYLRCNNDNFFLVDNEQTRFSRYKHNSFFKKKQKNYAFS